MKARRADFIAFALVGIGAVLGGSSLASADGTETLGAPSVVLAEGSGVAVGGIGLFTQPGALTVEVPDGAEVNQVLLYIEAGRRSADPEPTKSITVEGNALSCPIIGGPTNFYADVYHSTHRCDITGLGLVKAGSNTLSVSGLPDGDRNDGAGIMVIYREPGQDAAITMVDGTDTAFVDFVGDQRSTEPQTFTFDGSTVARSATMSFMVGSIANNTAPAYVPRPAILRLNMGGEITDILNPFDGEDDGAQFDARLLDITIPPGIESITAQLLSEYGGDGLPASLVWLHSSLAVPAPAPGTGTGPSEITAPTTAAPTTTAAPATTAAPTTLAVQPQVVRATTTTAAPVVVAAKQLPVTGGEAEKRGVLGAAIVASGLALLAGSRRREALR